MFNIYPFLYPANKVEYIQVRIMNKKTLAKLEYNKIIEQLIEHASSFSGKELCRRLKPMTDISAIRSAQDETAAAFTRIVKKGRPSFSGCNPVNDSIRRLEIGGVLGSGELLRICKLLETAGRARAYGRHDNADEMEDCLDGYFEQLNPVTILVNEIRRCVIDEDEISDDASPGLKHVRRAMNQINDKVHATLSNMVNGSLRTYLQDPIITMRGDRYCIPVKAEYRSQVSGMIHDQSATGSTLFIEPMAVVKLNNDLKELYGQEQEEIQKVLARLSADAAEYTTEIHTCYTILRQLDFIFAKGALALDMNASQPIFNTEGRIHIREGRHPLLDKKNVVPITLTLGDTFDLLIVTGPNTGGKTVSLKTVGLFTLMGQAGLHIPALDRSELAVFHDVYADIGDEQSIEQSLSTFSSHMTNIVSFLKQVDEHSLVLFDELGAAARAGDLDAAAAAGHAQLLAALGAAVVVVQLAVGPLLLQVAELVIEPVLQAVKAVVLLGALGDVPAEGAVVAEDQQGRAQIGEQADPTDDGDEEQHQRGNAQELVQAIGAIAPDHELTELFSHRFSHPLLWGFTHGNAGQQRRPAEYFVLLGYQPTMIKL